MSLGLSASQLAMMRAQVAQLLPDTAIIKNVVMTADGGGGYTEVTTAAGTVAARLDPLGQKDAQMIAGLQERAIHLYKATFEHDTALTIGDIVTVASVDYEVLQILDAHSDRVSVRCVIGRVL